MTNQQPLILISNDDGIDAPGLRYLVEQAAPLGHVIVSAPDSAQSGKASAITVDEPLRIHRHDDYCGAEMYSVSGTPVDCIKLALHAIVPRKPDIMLSRINHGSNSGNSVIYSGTMGSVMEACMAGIDAVGFSLLHHSWAADFSGCAETVQTIVSHVIRHGLPDDVCLNVNIPARCTPKGIKVVEASRGHWTEEYRDYTAPNGSKFYMLTGEYIDEDPDNAATDNYWLKREYVSVVPVRPDQTCTEAIPGIREMLEK